MLKNKTLTYISLFSCAGVGCFGFKKAGFECIATNELIERRLNVQKFNNKCKYESGYICDDITTDETKEKIFTEIDRWEKLGNDRVDVLVNGLKAQLKASNYTLKDYLSAYGIEDETTLRDQYKSSCESTVKVFLIADAIAADKKISVTDEDVLPRRKKRC